MSALFPGEARPLPTWSGPGWTITFGPDVPPPPPPVTHATGYEEFAEFVRASGTEPAVLIADAAAFGTFVIEHAAALQDDALARSAAVLLGNAVVVLHPRAVWLARQEPEVGGGATSLTVLRVVRALLDGEGTPQLLAEALDGWDEAERRHEADERALERAEAASLAVELADEPTFVRPRVEFPTYRDDQGDLIAYGSRWKVGETPDEAYSRVTHPERYAPLRAVAEALIEHLERIHDIVVDRSIDGEHHAVVTLRPSAGAPIRLTFTDFPGVLLRAGLLLDEAMPSCGCDACDSDPLGEVERLEHTVLGIVRGGLAELLPGGGPGGHYWLTMSDGSGSGGGRTPVRTDALVEPESVVALDGAAWPAWPRRD